MFDKHNIRFVIISGCGELVWTLKVYIVTDVVYPFKWVVPDSNPATVVSDRHTVFAVLVFLLDEVGIVFEPFIVDSITCIFSTVNKVSETRGVFILLQFRNANVLYEDIFSITELFKLPLIGAL